MFQINRISCCHLVWLSLQLGLRYFVELIVWDMFDVFTRLERKPSSSLRWKITAALQMISQWWVLFIIKCLSFKFLWFQPLETARICLIDQKTSSSWNPTVDLLHRQTDFLQNAKLVFIKTLAAQAGTYCFLFTCLFALSLCNVLFSTSKCKEHFPNAYDKLWRRCKLLVTLRMQFVWLMLSKQFESCRRYSDFCVNSECFHQGYFSFCKLQGG